MNHHDCTIPPNPTRDQQREALALGLGRAVQWARQGVLQPDLLAEACSVCDVFDRQIEDSRVEWLWRMIEMTGAYETVKRSVLIAFVPNACKNDADQLAGFCLKFAHEGDTDCREHLIRMADLRSSMHVNLKYLSLRSGNDWRIDPVEEAIVDLLGVDGILLLVAKRGEELKTREFEDRDTVLVEIAMPRFEESEVLSAMYESDDPGIIRFRTEFDASNTKVEEHENDFESSRKPDEFEGLVDDALLDRILSAAKASQYSPFKYAQLGRRLGEKQHELIVSAIEIESRDEVLIRLLAVFRDCELPRFVPKWIEFLDHPNEEFRFYAYNSIFGIEHPEIREYALDSAVRGFPEYNAIQLFEANFRTGDERIIHDNLNFETSDHFENHSKGEAILSILKEVDGVDIELLAPIVYRHSPLRLVSSGGCRNDDGCGYRTRLDDRRMCR